MDFARTKLNLIRLLIILWDFWNYAWTVFKVDLTLVNYQPILKELAIVNCHQQTSTASAARCTLARGRDEWPRWQKYKVHIKILQISKMFPRLAQWLNGEYLQLEGQPKDRHRLASFTIGGWMSWLVECSFYSRLIWQGSTESNRCSMTVQNMSGSWATS